MKTLQPATTVATINNQQIVIINDGEKRVAIKPICEALGVDYPGQFSKLKEDEILSSVIGLSPTTGSDGKTYEMTTIPLKFVFGWLFGINPKNVSESARESLIRYKLQCYDALWNHFSQYADFVEFKNKLIEQRLSVYEDIRAAFTTAKERLKEVQEELNNARRITFDDYKLEKRQLKIEFQELNEVAENTKETAENVNSQASPGMGN